MKRLLLGLILFSFMIFGVYAEAIICSPLYGVYIPANIILTSDWSDEISFTVYADYDNDGDLSDGDAVIVNKGNDTPPRVWGQPYVPPCLHVNSIHCPSGTRIIVHLRQAHDDVGYDWRDKTYILDNAAPTISPITVNGANLHGGSWYTNQSSPTIVFTASDDGSGVASVTVNGTSYPLASQYPTGNLAEGSNNIAVTATDHVGNVSSNPINITVVKDTTLPQITITPTNHSIKPINGVYYTNSSISFQGAATDNTGIDQIVWIAPNTSTGQTMPATNSCPTLSVDGWYTVTAWPYDWAGNAMSQSVRACVDSVAPVVANKPTLQLVGNGMQTPKVSVGWKAGDDGTIGSGIASYTVWYRVKALDGTSGYSIFYSVIPSPPTALSSEIDFSALHLNRAKAQQIQVVVTATDVAGNTVDLSGVSSLTNPQYASEIILPAEVGVSSFGKATLDSASDPSNPVMKNSMVLSVTKERAIADYDTLVLVRESSAGRTALPDDSLLAKRVVLTNEDIQGLPSDANGYLMVTDKILSSTSAGHKYICYHVEGTPKQCRFSEAGALSSETRLPNNPGSVSWKLYDVSGHEINIDGKGIITSDPAFKVYPDGKIWVSFQGSDLDQEGWSIELDRMKKVHGAPDIISSQRINGKTPLSYDTKTGSISEKIPITLMTGLNELRFVWNEGNSVDGLVENIKSELVDLTVDPEKVNGYSLVVTDAYADQSSTGILVRPGEPLTIEVKSDRATSASYAWDYGDGKSDTGPSVMHAYSQGSDSEQQSDTMIYKLSITISDSGTSVTPIAVNIQVKDTQEGELFTSEVWRGDHTMTGVVEVPSGMVLTVGSVGVPNDMGVYCSGGPGAGYGQGILVKSGGRLMMDNGTHVLAIAKQASQVQGWGAIYISSGANATIRNATIRDADRGVAIESGAQIVISGGVLEGNVTGIQAFGGSTVRIENAVITENSVYGVKEEASADPVMIGDHIYGNMRDYYSWQFGLLTVEDLNGIAGNSDNVSK